MGSTGQAFYSTPAFELFRRGLTVQAVKRFRGINAFASLTDPKPDCAASLLNVIVGSNGLLSKMRLPINLSVAIPGIVAGPNTFWDFQQANGTRQVLAQFGENLYVFTNNLAVANLIESNLADLPNFSFVEANNILFGANGNVMKKWTGNLTGSGWQNWGIAAPINGPLYGPFVAGGGLSPTVGYSYKYAWKNSVTGHVSSASPASVSTGPQATKQIQVNAIAPTDPQVDTIVWYRTQDGGGNWYRLAEVTLATAVVTFNNATVVAVGVGNIDIVDNTPDTALDLTIQGSFINGPPPQGTFVATTQGRIFVGGLPGNPSQVAYSGYEQILTGRPEESFPPNNVLQLQIGADAVSGLGILHRGLVIFSNTSKMYALRGAIEDIVISAPPTFSATLEELPWTLGCMSHLAIASTPYGLIWLAADKTVQFWDGFDPPTDISAPIYPILRTITPGTESQCIGAFFNWLERDWYALVCATGGSLTPNTLIFFSFPALTENVMRAQVDIQNIDIFVSNIPALSIGVVNTAQLQRKLLIGTGGRIAELPVRAIDVNGLTNDYATYPPTNGQLVAYWRSFPFGNENPQQSKMFRWSRLVTDVGNAGFQLTSYYVDEANTIAAPVIQGPVVVQQNKTPLNRRAFRCQVEINFPVIDAPADVLELQTAWIATSER